MKKILAALAALLVLLPATDALAQTTVTKKVTVPGTAVFQHGPRPTDPGNCSALVFVQWTNPPNATVLNATAKMRLFNRDYSENAAGPAFHDTTEWVRVYTVTPGAHWIMMSKSWADGPRANDCSGMSAKQQAAYDRSVPVTVDLVIDNSAKCTAAQAALKKAQTGLTKARARLKKAKSAKGKRRERTSVRKNQAKVRKAQTAATAECTSS